MDGTGYGGADVPITCLLQSLEHSPVPPAFKRLALPRSTSRLVTGERARTTPNLTGPSKNLPTRPSLDVTAEASCQRLREDEFGVFFKLSFRRSFAILGEGLTF